MINRTAIRILVVAATAWGMLIPFGWEWDTGIFVFWSTWVVTFFVLVVSAAYQDLKGT